MGRTTTGFTLIEVMIAALASVIVSGIAIGGVITFQQMNQRLEAKLNQEEEMQRALRYIAADIRSGRGVRPNPPSLTGYDGLLEIIQPSGVVIGYYTTPKGGRVWSGPRIIHRRDFSKPDGSERPLIDQIAAVPPANCTGPGTLVSNGTGFSVRIEQEKQVTLCLRGDVPDSPTDLEASLQVVTRVP
jgi:type II secretory pathway pseudopilin PulG